MATRLGAAPARSRRTCGPSLPAWRCSSQHVCRVTEAIRGGGRSVVGHEEGGTPSEPEPGVADRLNATSRDYAKGGKTMRRLTSMLLACGVAFAGCSSKQSGTDGNMVSVKIFKEG